MVHQYKSPQRGIIDIKYVFVAERLNGKTVGIRPMGHMDLTEEIQNLMGFKTDKIRIKNRNFKNMDGIDAC